MFKTPLVRLEKFWHKIEQGGTSERTVIAVTASSVQLELRILSIQERWHILFARTLETALQSTPGNSRS
jgi:hypothetical protein